MTIDANGDLRLQGVSVRSLPKVASTTISTAPYAWRRSSSSRKVPVSICPPTVSTGSATGSPSATDSGSLVEYISAFGVVTDVMQTREGSPGSRGSSSRISPRTA